MWYTPLTWEKACNPMGGELHITAIEWWNSYISVHLSEAVSSLSLQSEEGEEHPFIPVDFRNGQNEWWINVANVDRRQLLPEGTWQIVCNGFSSVLYDLPEVASLSRVIPFCGGRREYVVDFLQQRGQVRLRIGIKEVAKRTSIKSAAKNCVKSLFSTAYSAASRVTAKRGNRVLFMSENNENLTGNLLALSQRMNERPDCSHLELDYSFRNVFRAKYSPLSWANVLYRFARSDYVFLEDYVPFLGWIKAVHPDTKVIQTWHAGFGFKLVGLARFGVDSDVDPYRLPHRRYTHALVGNESLKNVYTEVFGIEREALLATGMPRLSRFLDAETQEAAKQRFAQEFPEALHKRVILYAPTYRGGSQREADFDYNALPFDQVADFCRKTGALFIVKMHRFIVDSVPIPEDCKDVIFDASSWDINTLLYSVDVLITDYSSCFYDYLLLDRPVLFYAFDEEEYAQLRGIHRSLEDFAPGAICRSFDELMEALGSPDDGMEFAAEKRERLMDRACEGTNACDECIDAVIFGKTFD